MTGRSIRVRLTAWYLGLLTLATLLLSAGSWWLIRRSMVNAADSSLSARVNGVRQFIERLGHASPTGEMQDEFREYAELTLGETLLDVRDASGTSLYRPVIRDWDQLRTAAAQPLGRGALTFGNLHSQGRPFRVVATRLVVQGSTYDVVAALPMGAADAALVHFSWLLAGLVPAVLALAAVGGYWISGRALAPVDRMTRAAQAITVRHLDRRLDVPQADDELRRLAMTFNDMLARLQASVADLSRLTAEASHELRTPVSLVRATAEVALGRDRSVAEYRQALSEVVEHAERMSNLVGDMLALARADAGVEPPETAIVDVRSIAREAAREVQATAVLRSLSIVLDLAGEPIDVEGHPESLRRLVTVLLDNAVKYTPAGGTIRLSASVKSEPAGRDVAELSVTDTGIGIDAAEASHVFDRFYRGSAARQYAADGSGLGLAIAQTIVARQGGSISLATGPDGRGCRAEVRLPLAARAAVDAGVGRESG